MNYDQRKNYKLVLEYDGSNYHGWQRQKGLLTIQEVVETRLAIMTQTPVRLVGAGRTDAGVHARGPVGRVAEDGHRRFGSLRGSSGNLMARKIWLQV